MTTFHTFLVLITEGNFETVRVSLVDLRFLYNSKYLTGKRETYESVIIYNLRIVRIVVILFPFNPVVYGRTYENYTTGKGEKIVERLSFLHKPLLSP